MVRTETDAVARGRADADAEKSRRFQQLALPHLDAAYNLARWLCGNPNDADDVVQEAFMRAFRFFDTFRGDTARPWLLAIVRRTWYTEWRRRAPPQDMLEFDDTMDDATFDGWSAGGDDPQTLVIRDEDTKLVHEALAQLPVEFREVLILRELEEMEYREIAAVADLPIGTVMSRLARGRRKLATVLMQEQGGPARKTGKPLRTGRSGSSQGTTTCPEPFAHLQHGFADSPGNVQPVAGSPPTPEHSTQAPPAPDQSGATAATVTPLRASVNGRPGAGAAGFAQETPDGL